MRTGAELTTRIPRTVKEQTVCPEKQTVALGTTRGRLRAYPIVGASLPIAGFAHPPLARMMLSVLRVIPLFTL